MTHATLPKGLHRDVQVCTVIPMTTDTYSTEADLMPIGEAARMLGVSVGTVRRWEREGKISATRTLGGQRRFVRDDIVKKIKAAA